jgi:hypothetical protein
MDYSDETDALQPLKMDVSFQFGRFICLTPSNKQEAVRPLQDLNKVKEAIDKQQSTNEDAPLNLDNVLKRTKAVKPAILNKPDLAGTSKPAVPAKKTTVKKTTKKK